MMTIRLPKAMVSSQAACTTAFIDAGAFGEKRPRETNVMMTFF
jgi:hypothetical protein